MNRPLTTRANTARSIALKLMTQTLPRNMRRAVSESDLPMTPHHLWHFVRAELNRWEEGDDLDDSIPGNPSVASQQDALDVGRWLDTYAPYSGRHRPA